jgi:hypothetical protein
MVELVSVTGFEPVNTSVNKKMKATRIQNPERKSDDMIEFF